MGGHAAERLTAAKHDVTIVDADSTRLAQIENELDIRTLRGNAANASVLAEAGCSGAGLVLAATNDDETNLVIASTAKHLGAQRTIARVHHSDYIESPHLDYAGHFGIDRLICPEFVAALTIAQTLRNPGALAIELFAQGAIEMQQFPVARDSEVIGKSLLQITLPKHTRVAAIGRLQSAFIPEAGTVIEQGDTVIMVGDASHFHIARRIFHDNLAGRRRVVIMGGPPMAIWLARALRDRNFAIRIFEQDPERAEVLADQLDWVTVIHGDPTDSDLFAEEHIGESDAFVALTNDEENILACVLAKRCGVNRTVAVVQRPKYVHLLQDIGVDHTFSPRRLAAREIERMLDERPLRALATLAEGVIDVYRVRVGDSSETIGKPLREVKLTPNWMLAAIQRNGVTTVPGANDQIEQGDTIIAIGRHGKEDALRKIFATG